MKHEYCKGQYQGVHPFTSLVAECKTCIRQSMPKRINGSIETPIESPCPRRIDRDKAKLEAKNAIKRPKACVCTACKDEGCGKAEDGAGSPDA